MKGRLRTGSQTLVLVLAIWGALVVGQQLAHAGLITVPNAQLTIEGNDADNFTFSTLAPGFPPSVRFQQVYRASEFAALTEPMFITRIAFRPDGVSGTAFSAMLPHVQIDLSTTSRTPDDIGILTPPPPFLGNLFSGNIGADNTVVFDGPLVLSSANTGPPGGPKAFDIVIELQRPFLYDPTSGNLLLDVRNFSNISTTFFDAQTAINDSVLHVDAPNVSATLGSRFTSGLDTQFEFAAIPEPPTIALFSIGIVALVSYRGRCALRWLRRGSRVGWAKSQRCPS